MKTIILHSKTYGTKEVLVDDSDHPHLVKHHWVLDKSKGTFYVYHRGSDPAGRLIKWKMHRVLLGLTDGSIVGDHIDGNGLNNQRSNLRIATFKQNTMNRRPANKQTGYKGVCFSEYKGKRYYKCEIMANAKRYREGKFNTAEEAARRWNELAREHHGEFAYQNPV